MRDLSSLGRTVAVAESLTGGLVTDALVAVPGASTVLLGGVTAYRVPVKVALLGVDPSVVEHDGVVSSPVALAMATGARRMFGADVGVSTTGVAGPGPSDGRGAGTVVVAAVSARRSRTRAWTLGGTREQVRIATAALALALTADLVAELVAEFVAELSQSTVSHREATGREHSNPSMR